MARAEKLLAAMRANPQGDWRISDVETLARSYGIACKAPRRGSHGDLNQVAARYDREPGQFMTIDVHSYPVYVEPLTPQLGGGYVSYAPDLKGCVSDGGTPEEAFRNIYDAIGCWIAVALERGEPVPQATVRHYA